MCCVFNFHRKENNKDLNSNKSIECLYENLSKSRYDAFQYSLNGVDFKFRTAYEEACMWLELGYKLENNNYFNRQAYVVLAYAQELFIKSILLKQGVNFSKIHSLDSLFNLISSKDKAKIIKKIKINSLDVIDKDGNIIQRLNNFDDYLKFISKYFVKLRYEFEKVNFVIPTTIPTKFFNDFAFVLYMFCEKDNK